MQQNFLEKELLFLFAAGCSNKSVQRYIHNLREYNFDVELSKNRYTPPDLLIEIFHTLKTGDKIVALDRFLSKELITGFLVKQPMVVNQAVFEVSFVRCSPGGGVLEYAITQPWMDASMALHLIDTLPWYSVSHEIKMLAQFGHSNQKDLKRGIANCRGRSTVIRNRMTKSKHGEFVSYQPAGENLQLLQVKVKQTMGISRMDSLVLTNTVGSVVGEQTPEYWRTLFALASSWSDTYETLIQTTASIMNSNK